jgi:hypothetical protein
VNGNNWLAKLTDYAATQGGPVILRGFSANALAIALLAATPWLPGDWRAWVAWPIYLVIIAGVLAMCSGAMVPALRELRSALTSYPPSGPPSQT